MSIIEKIGWEEKQAELLGSLTDPENQPHQHSRESLEITLHDAGYRKIQDIEVT